MSDKLLKNIKLNSEVIKFYKKNKEFLLDIILFGSYLKGKEKPNDIDLLVLYKNKKDFDKGYELKKILEKKGYKADITNKNYPEIFDKSFKVKEAILSEGYSFINKKFISEGLGYTSLILFKYELKGFSKSNRTRFYYSLYGRKRKNKGILNDFGALKFSDTILLCPIENSERMKDYFNNWKINYIEFPIMIPTRLKEFLQRKIIN